MCQADRLTGFCCFRRNGIRCEEIPDFNEWLSTWHQKIRARNRIRGGTAQFYNRAAAELLQRYRIKYDNPIYLTETLAIWLKYGMCVIEFPSVYIGRNEGLSKLRWSDLLEASLVSFEIAWRYHVTGFAPRIGGAEAAASPLLPASGDTNDGLPPLIPAARRPLEEHGSTPGEGIP